MSTVDSSRQFHSSELSRNATKVFAAAEDHPVLVTRRDGESLVLMSEREANARRKLFEFAAQLIAVTTDDRGTLAERMADHFPWMYALSPVDRDRCAADLVDAARAAFATDEARLVLAEVTAWRETAGAVAAGLGGVDVEWLDPVVEVERPE